MLPALALAAAAVCGAPATGPQADCERFLRTARVVETRPLGEGITASHRVELREGATSVRAVFKTVDVRFENLERVGDETVTRYADSWKHEVVAYELDKLLGLHLVPPAVERRIDGQRGSLQAWVDRPIARFGGGWPSAAGVHSIEDGVHVARVLDYLIYNRDRHVRNLLFGPDWRPIAIDHSIALQAFARPFRPLYRFPRVAVERLTALDKRTLEKAVGKYLDGEERDGLWKRVQALRAHIAAERTQHGDAAVLFDW